MSKFIIVEENHTLFQIAKKAGLNVDTLMQANPTFFPGLMNPYLLAPTMKILVPDKRIKKTEQSSGTKKTYTVQKSPKQFLALTLEDKNGEIQGIDLIINNKKVPDMDIEDIKQPPNRIIKAKKELFEDLPFGPDTQTNNLLKIKFKSSITGEEFVQQIEICIGGLDPILDPTGTFPNETDHIVPKKAVQKLLKNIGYYHGEIDGDLNGKEVKKAIGGFQMDFMQLSTDDANFEIPDFRTLIELAKQHGLKDMGAVQPIKINGKNK